VYGSSPHNWPAMAKKAKEQNWAFSISVGPGYDDTRIRPWNAQNTKSREKGHYYDKMWGAALEVNPSYVSITSYNEWMEGTQIEAAVPKSIAKTIFNSDKYTYQDYSPLEPDYYIKKTHEWATKFIQRKR
jgi:glycoprotein endo-alpha-1,2-mannosidase